MAVMSRVALALAAVTVFTAAPAYAQTPERPLAFLLFVDNLHLDFRVTPRTRALMQRVLREVAREGDVWSVVTTGPSSLSVGPTKDLDVIREAVPRIVGTGLRPAERVSVAPGPVLLELKHRADVAYAAAVTAIERLAAAAPGATLTVLYFSEGYDGRLVEGPRALVDAATRLGATVFAVRPSFIEPVPPADIRPAEWAAYVAATQETLHTLAAETGGFVALGPDDIDLLLQRVAPAR
jgi:hypothetical protein